MIKPTQYTKLKKKCLEQASKRKRRPILKGVRSLPVFGRMTLTKGQEKELDRLWSMAVKARAGNRCEKSGSVENLQAHHAIGRRNKTLRHVVSNGFCLSAKWHMWAEQNSIAFAEWAIKSRGQKWWDDLQAYGREVKVWKDYTVIREYLMSFLDRGNV